MKSKETPRRSKSEMCSGRNDASIEQDIYVKRFSCGFLNVGTIISCWKGNRDVASYFTTLRSVA